MKTIESSRATSVLRRAVAVAGTRLEATYPWLKEEDRWHELVFALLTRVVSRPEDEVRRLTAQLVVQDMLDIAALAHIRTGRGAYDLDSAAAQEITEFLREEAGLSADEARRALIALCDVASGLQEHHAGKVQRYLRAQGELMLRELDKTFTFSSLSRVEVADAFTYWLQNVTSMPLSLVDDNVKAFCAEHGIEVKSLIEAADEIGLNLGAMDDLILAYVKARTEVGAPQHAEAVSTRGGLRV